MISFELDWADRQRGGRAAAGRKHRRKTADAGLWLLLQLDAFRIDPVEYLRALAWRARGFKVRSRNRMAVLTGQSRFAYPYWMARREPALHAPYAKADPAPMIVPVIDCSAGGSRVEEAVASMPGDAKPIIIGGNGAGDANTDALRRVASLSRSEVWLCPIACGDRLAPTAMAAYAAAIAANPQARLVYSDDDLMDADGHRRHPHFKPDWNPELFDHHDFVTGACVVRADLGTLTTISPGLQRNLVETATAGPGVPVHLPLILHHRLERPEPVVPSRPAKVDVEGWPPVSVIIPTRNRADLLRTCIEGVLRTDYPTIEVLVIDNESDEPESVAYLEALKQSGIRVIRMAGPFNYSRLNNAAVREAGGELLCFLNNDIEIIEGDWLSLLCSHAVKPDIGAVGARLLYADGTVQHAGVFTGLGGGAGHAHRFLKQGESGYFDRANLPQRVSAVTAACLVVARDKFVDVGGFDEVDFPVAFNDVDLCLKLNGRGWQSFYEPRASLVHHESKSRGNDRSGENKVRFAGELATLKRKWATDVASDPFHHPQLSRFCEQFVISV